MSRSTPPCLVRKWVTGVVAAAALSLLHGVVAAEAPTPTSPQPAAAAKRAAKDARAPAKAKQAVARGRKLQDAGDLDGALAAYRSAVKADPRSAEAHYRAGTVHVVRGRKVEAYESLLAAMKLDPAYAEPAAEELLKLEHNPAEGGAEARTDQAPDQPAEDPAAGMRLRDMELFIAISTGDAAKVGQALDAGGDVNARGRPSGHTPLMAAAMDGSAAVVKLLLERGGDPAVRDEHGDAALDYARDEGHEAVVALLEEAGGKKEGGDANDQEEDDLDAQLAELERQIAEVKARQAAGTQDEDGEQTPKSKE